MSKLLYIRPVCDNKTDTLLGLALTRKDVLVDSDIIAHFPKDEKGVDIKAFAVEFGHVSDVSHVAWGSPFCV
jgi:hypothetical protein